MSLLINAYSSIVNPSDTYAVATLAVGVWSPVELPLGSRVVASVATGAVVMREGESAVVPVGPPAGVGTIMQAEMQLNAATTHLHLYTLAGAETTVYMNFYEG